MFNSLIAKCNAIKDQLIEDNAIKRTTTSITQCIVEKLSEEITEKDQLNILEILMPYSDTALDFNKIISTLQKSRYLTAFKSMQFKILEAICLDKFAISDQVPESIDEDYQRSHRKHK